MADAAADILQINVYFFHRNPKEGLCLSSQQMVKQVFLTTDQC